VKIGYVLLDGCADRPDPRLNYTTPLEAACTPNLDEMASRSRLGTVTTVGRGIAPESDIAVFNMLGYSFKTGYPGRGVVEAVGAGVRFKDGDLALRANFAFARGAKIIDRRAGRDLSQREAKELERVVNEVRLDGADFVFRSTVGYRGVLVVRAGGGLSSAVSNTDPAYARVGGFGAARAVRSGDKVARCEPENDDPKAKRSAQLVNEFTERAAKRLSGAETNSERVREGKMPANCVLLRDAGDHLPTVRSFRDKYGLDGTALVEMPAEVGIARLLGMRMVRTDEKRSMTEKAKTFLSELRDGRMVYAHLKGPDEFGHDGDVVGKTRCIESIDRDFFSSLTGIGDATLGVSCDHATPCSIKMHSDDPVPLLVSGGARDSARFTEERARGGSLGHLAGADVLGVVLRRRTS